MTPLLNNDKPKYKLFLSFGNISEKKRTRRVAGAFKSNPDFSLYRCNQIDSGCISPFLSICTPVGWIRRIIFWWSLISLFSIFTCRYRQIDSIIHGRQACSICPFCELDQLDPPVEYVDKYRQWLGEERYKETCLEKALPLNFEKMVPSGLLVPSMILESPVSKFSSGRLSVFCPQPMRTRQSTIAIINKTNTAILFFMVLPSFILIFFKWEKNDLGMCRTETHSEHIPVNDTE